MRLPDRSKVFFAHLAQFLRVFTSLSIGEVQLSSGSKGSRLTLPQVVVVDYNSLDSVPLVWYWDSTSSTASSDQAETMTIIKIAKN